MTAQPTLYDLLPAVHRLRDADNGDALRGLIGVLQEQLDVVDADIAALYENWFIETADRWVVPYIGDLVATRTLATSAHETDTGLSALPRQFSQRAYVANTIGYRRRKGTAAVLEQVAFDVTGWHARAVEFFQLLATNQYVKHVRPGNVAVPDLRAGAALARLDGPFETAAHTVDVHAIDPAGVSAAAAGRRGRYAVQNVGVFLWRLQPYRVSGAWARGVQPAVAGFTFDPLGLDEPLFTPPRTEREISHLAEEPDVPGLLPPRDLTAELDALRQAEVDDAPPMPGAFFRPDAVPFAVAYATAGAPETLVPVPPDQISICDLSTWRRPSPTRLVVPADGGPPQPRTIVAGVDPVLGRIAFPAGIDPVRVVFDASHGFSGDIGGGPYDRRDSTERWLEPDEVSFQIGVTRDGQAVAASTLSERLVPSLADAIAAWATESAASNRGFGLIVVMDSARYDEDLVDVATIEVPAGWRLAIVAADWPDERAPDAVGGTPIRTRGRIAADKGLRPHLRGAVNVRGTAPANAKNPGELIVSGLLVEGRLTVVPGNLGRLTIVDSTLVPSAGGLSVESTGSGGQANRSLEVSLDRSITGAVSLPSRVRRLHAADSIVDADDGPSAIDAAGALVDLDAVSVLGALTVERLEASDCLFTAPLAVNRRQEGCVRYSHVPDASSTPRRFRCQPDLALAGETDPTAIARILAELTPVFTSTRYRDPGYGQLGRAGSPWLRVGAENGAEMGAFNSLLQAQREANLRIALGEYLRSGLDAGIFFVT